MASNYPTSLDSFTNPSAGNTLDSPSHSLQHSDINDAVEALETKIGIGDSPAGSATSGQVLTAQGGGTAIWATPDSGALVLIQTQTVSAVSAVNFNDVFSATYNNYLINIQATSAAQSNMSLRLRAAGTDASGADYVTQRLNVDNATITAARATGQTAFEIATAVSSGTFVNNFILANPFAAKNTFMNPFANARLLNTLDFSMWTGNHTLTTSYDGFSVLGSTSFSGTISVYGFKE